MRVHHLNCATMCPKGGWLVQGRGPVSSEVTLVCHCLLVETPASGLALVDTGLGTADVLNPRRRLGAIFTLTGRPRCDPAETAKAQVERLGFRPEDVRHIALTHLDLDHAGGLSDFPKARVHLLAAEHSVTRGRRSIGDVLRYRPAQWAHGPDWAPYEAGAGEAWFGFECVRDLSGLPPEILLIPLIGHARGHTAVAVKGDAGWMLHAGDAYVHRGQIDPVRPRCPPALDIFGQVIAWDRRRYLANVARLRALAAEQKAEVRVFSAHDPVELRRAIEAQQTPARP